MGDRAAAAGLPSGEPSPEQRLGAPRVIAVDGSAASGKSTVSRRLASKLGYPFLDTGVMYRAITVAALKRKIDVHDQASLGELAASVRMDVGAPEHGSSESCTIAVDGKDVTGKLRDPEVEDAVSLVSRVAAVREALVRLQREIAGRQAMV